MGRAGAASKWARTTTPEARRAATRAARDARWANLLARAQAMAEERGETLTSGQLADRAQHLQRLDLARARLRRRLKAADPKAVYHAPDTVL